MQGAATRLPELKRVIVVFGNRVVMRDRLDQALAEIFGGAPGAAPPVEQPTGEPVPPTPDEPPALGDVQSLLDQALAETIVDLRDNGDTLPADLLDRRHGWAVTG